MQTLPKYPGVPWIWHKSPRLLYRSPNLLGKLNFELFWALTSYQTLLACMFCFPNSDHVKFSRKFAFCLYLNYAHIGTWKHMHKGVGRHLNKEKVLWGTITWSEMWKQNNYNLNFFHYSFNHGSFSGIFSCISSLTSLMVCSSCKTTCNVQGGWCWGIL